jgi:hypothetical protein
MGKRTVFLIVAASLVLLNGGAYAAQPTTTDFDACNREALEKLKTGPSGHPAASPQTERPASPAATTPAPGTSTPTPPSAAGSPSKDPQLQGIKVGADATYQEAYRECMKRRGF